MKAVHASGCSIGLFRPLLPFLSVHVHAAVPQHSNAHRLIRDSYFGGCWKFPQGVLASLENCMSLVSAIRPSSSEVPFS